MRQAITIPTKLINFPWYVTVQLGKVSWGSFGVVTAHASINHQASWEGKILGRITSKG